MRSIAANPARISSMIGVVVFVVLQGATLPAQEPPGDSIEGWTEDQVREALGRPSIRDRQPDGTVVWYYDRTSKGTVRVYFTNGQVARVRPEDGFREVWLKELARRSSDKASTTAVDEPRNRSSPRRLDEALRQAAEQGDAEAQFTLGARYESGRGVAQDAAVAVRWYRRAAQQGHVTAQFRLGDMYRDGRSVPQDDLEAVRWFYFATEQGHSRAASNLGWMYQNGRGVPQNDGEAVRLYRRAADQGLAEAQYNLGLMYDLGQGVPQDRVAGHMWLTSPPHRPPRPCVTRSSRREMPLRRR